MMIRKNNHAHIDGQNLHLGTSKSSSPWRVDLRRFRIYLKDKYHVREAFYYLGYADSQHERLYENIRKAGFVIVFREHSRVMTGKKKGNVDSDIIFNIMSSLYEKQDFEKIVMVSGDGDYKTLVDFLISEKKFEKILFPDKKYSSSLYKKLGSEYFAFLEDSKIHIEKK